jgi:quercetin dioxygenase-like cupin family protein
MANAPRTSYRAGMHRSATTDMLYVISGRCVLELDDGSKTEISAGDVVVQSGTMHRWHNPFAVPCRVLGVLVGARWTK